MSVTQKLFTEHFRPQKLEQLIASPRIKKELEKGLVQNLLLYGTAGTGKTSTAFVLSKDYTRLYINTSSEGRIDVIREKITKFCTSLSLENNKEKLKCVILDEMDGASDEFFKALRAVMEKYADKTRFIATCNYINKIPDPVQSRFNCISFDPINKSEEDFIKDQYSIRISAILTHFNINHTSESLSKFLDMYFPDLRSILNKIQSLTLQQATELDVNSLSSTFDYSDLYELIIHNHDKPWENYKLITSEYASKIDEVLISLGNDFPEFIKTKYPAKLNKLPQVLITVAQYQYERAFVIDSMTTLLACIYKLQLTLV